MTAGYSPERRSLSETIMDAILAAGGCECSACVLTRASSAVADRTVPPGVKPLAALPEWLKP